MNLCLTIKYPTDNIFSELWVKVDKDERLNAAVDQGQWVGGEEGGEGGQLGHPRHDEYQAKRADAEHEEASDNHHLDCDLLAAPERKGKV